MLLYKFLCARLIQMLPGHYSESLIGLKSVIIYIQACRKTMLFLHGNTEMELAQSAFLATSVRSDLR
jgi:hypothetical protein